MLIGTVARKGHGKDATGDYLVGKHEFRKVAFAAKVKDVTWDLFPQLAACQLFGTITEKEAKDPYLNVSGRQLLQLVGTEVGRQGDMEALRVYGVGEARVRNVLRDHDVTPGPLAWVNALFSLGFLAKVDTRGYVITDVRFPNEAAAVQANGGTIIKVVRPDLDTGEHNGHASETEVDNCPFDHEVLNDGTLQDLYAKIDEIIKWHKENP